MSQNQQDLNAVPGTSALTLLVTGGAGFIGSNFVHYWVNEAGGRVVNLDKLTYAGNPANLDSLNGNRRHIFVKGDIGDRELIARLLREHAPVALVNFAAESHVDRSIHGPEEFVTTNVVGTFRLLEEVRAYHATLLDNERNAFRFLHVSTDEVYGSLSAADPAFTEMSPYAPNSPYSATKAASDHLVRAYHHTYGLPTLTTNCSNNYGPYQFPEKLIPLIIFNALHERPLPVYGDGMNVRDWLYVRDHCTAIHRVLTAGRVGETYNIGGQCELKNIDVVHTVCDALDEMAPSSRLRSHRELITYVEDRPGHDRRYAIDISKIRRELKWTPAETFESGIRKTIRWCVENPAWFDQMTKNEYGSGMSLNYGGRIRA